MSAPHYTAVLEVTKTTPPAPPTTTYRDSRHPAPADPSPRSVSEVARVVIRAASLEALVAKVGAHAALIEEGGA